MGEEKVKVMEEGKESGKRRKGIRGLEKDGRMKEGRERVKSLWKDIVENAFGAGGLPGIDVRHDAEVAVALKRVFACHGAASSGYLKRMCRAPGRDATMGGSPRPRYQR